MHLADRIDRLLRSAAFVLATGGLAACTGYIGAGDQREDGATGDDDGNVDPLADSPAPIPLRRLTPFEIDRSLAELLGDDSHAALGLYPDHAKARFETDPRHQGMTREVLEAYDGIVYAAAQRATTDLDALLGCTSTGVADACTTSFVERFGKRAFSRALDDAEREKYLDIVRKLEPTHGKNEAIARAIEAILMSPSFLYLTAFGEPGIPETEDQPLQAHELAARLSFFLWGQVPDEALLDAAERGALATDEGLKQEAERLLADPRAAASAARFFAGWLDVVRLGSLPKSDPEWTAALRSSVERQTTAVVEAWFAAGVPMSELLSSDTTLVDANLARLYGLAGDFGGDLVSVSGTRAVGRDGLLGQASFLASHSMERSSSPTLRGKWVIERALCKPMGAPPAEALQNAPMLVQGMSTREWHEAIQAGGACAGCHDVMEPPGYLFEGFDAIGRARATDAGKPVRTDAVLTTGVDEIDGAHADARGLAAAMSTSETVRDCVAEQWLEYATGRDTSGEDADVAPVAEALATRGDATALTIVMSRSFRNAKIRTEKP